MVIETFWVVMRNNGKVKDEATAKQVYGGPVNPVDFDRICEMTAWLNKNAQGGFYWMKEIQRESGTR